MRLVHGSRLGHYEIGALIGAGGMGEVYRARDTRLQREVAIKVLPDLFAADPARRARLEREAQMLASLNHPHIATIYGLEETNGMYAVVMELVEGEDLTQRIARGALPLDEALHIAGQLAAALAAAHHQHVIHRDLKPGNIKLRGEGTVKVLDFGLAKALDPASLEVAAAVSGSPTFTSPAALTGAGILLGTAAYMSPEQARGKVADKRADIWAFGVVLFEMLTGTPLNARESLPETLAAVLKDEPDLSRVPPSVRRLLRSCLQKDPAQRLHDMADWKLLLDDPMADATLQPPSRRQWLWPSIAALATLGFIAAVASGVIGPRETTPVAALEYGEFSKPADLVFNEGTQATISPDGKSFAFVAQGPDGKARIYTRSFDSPDARPLADSDGIVARSPPPFWSYDSRFVFYTVRQELRKSEVAGTSHQLIAPIGVDFVQGGTSNHADVIVYARSTGKLEQVSARGGTPRAATELAPGEIAHRWPQFLPDGRRFLYLVVGNSPEQTGIYVGSLDVAPDKQNRKRLVATERHVRWVTSEATGKTYLLMQREETLLAQPFDVAAATLSGSPVPIANGVGAFANATAGMWSAADHGRLIYRAGGTGPTQLTWLGANRDVPETLGEPGGVSDQAVSPNGDRVAYVVKTSVSSEIWIRDVESGGTIRLTSDARPSLWPVWSFDGAKVLYTALRGGRFDLYEIDAEGHGAEKLLYTSDQDKYPTDASRDGRFLLFTSTDPKTNDDLWVLDLGRTGGKGPQAFPLVQGKERQMYGRFDRDQRWIAYVDQAGTPQIIVRPVPIDVRSTPPGQGVSWSVSVGTHPRWSPDGRRLYYLGSGNLWVVDVLSGTGTTFQFRLRPQPLVSNFTTQPWSLRSRPSGDQFLVARTKQASGPPPPFQTLSNWIAHKLEQ